MSMWVSLCCSLVLMDRLIILERWLVIVLAEDRSFTAGWLQLKHSFTVKAYWPRCETESWFMSYQTNGPGTVPFFAASTVAKYLNLSELWYFFKCDLWTGIFSLFSAIFLWTQCIYVFMEAQFCLRVKNKRHSHQE